MLEDVVVAELGTSFAARQCGKMLVDAGATVVALVDQDGAAKAARLRYLPDYLDAGKTVQPVPAGGCLAPGFAARIDVFVHDGTSAHDALARDVQAANPALVVVTASDYGLTGPDRDTPANEFTLQAESGLTVLHPTHDRPPVTTGVDLVEITTALEMAKAVVEGLLAVDAGAPGVTADVSRFEAGVGLATYPWLNGRIEGHRPYAAPSDMAPGIEAAADGFVCIIALTPDQWSGLKKMVGDPALDDPRFDNPMARMAEAAELRGLIRAFTAQHTTAALVEMGVAHRVPVVPVTTPGTVAELPPHVARGTFVRNPWSGHLCPRPPYRWSPADEPEGGRGGWEPAPALVQGEMAVHPCPERSSLTPEATGAAPLAGIRVLELGLFHAGPLVTRHLAALGADVVKVESVMRPDPIRLLGVPMDQNRFWERGAAFLAPNIGKRAITLDLAADEGIEAFRRLVAESDVVVENYAPRTLDSRGLDYPGLRAIKPDVIVARMPAWGLEGPWRDRPGFTYTADATSGMADLTGYPDGDPLMTGTVVDPFSALIGAFAVLAALRRRARTGQGGQIELALCDSATLLSAPAVIAATTPDSSNPTRSGNDHLNAVPQGCYRAADGTWVAVSVATDDQWRALAGAEGMPSWTRAPELLDVHGRRARAGDLDAALSDLCAALPAASVVDLLRAAGAPAAPVALGTDLVDHRQLLARGRVFEVDHPVVGSLPYIAGASLVSGTSGPAPTAPCPLFGEHNVEVFTAIGYGDDDLQRLQEANVIGWSPFNLPYSTG